MSIESSDVEVELSAFLTFCAVDGIRLLPHQVEFARTVIASNAYRQFYLGGLGSGRTFVTQRLELFFDAIKRTSEHKS